MVIMISCFYTNYYNLKYTLYMYWLRVVEGSSVETYDAPDFVNAPLL